MCIIAVLKQGQSLTDDEIDTCWYSNDDGAGFAYVNDKGRPVVRKGFMKKEDFIKAFKSVHEKFGSKSPFLVHFRIRTHGALDAERTHPFYIGKAGNEPRPCLVHNGVLNCVEFDKEKSDTQLFIERYPDFFKSAEVLESVKAELGGAIGWSKFAVLFPDKQVVIVNEKSGVTNSSGVWFSNSGFKSYSNYMGRGHGYSPYHMD